MHSANRLKALEPRWRPAAAPKTAASGSSGHLFFPCSLQAMARASVQEKAQLNSQADQPRRGETGPQHQMMSFSTTITRVKYYHSL